MEKLTHIITLIHCTTKEERPGNVLFASDNWKLHLRLGFAGDYWFDIKKDRLFKTQHSRLPILWRALDTQHVIDVWKNITTRGVYISERLRERLSSGIDDAEILRRRVAKAEADVQACPSDAAIEWSQRQR